VISALGPSLDRHATGMPLVQGTQNIVDALRVTCVRLPRAVGDLADRDRQRPRVDDRALHSPDRRPRYGHGPGRPPRPRQDRRSITRADIAAFLLDQLDDTRFVRAAPAISN
jgi:hypothetical protein